MKKNGCVIAELNQEDFCGMEEALSLVERVFMAYEAPEYPTEGIAAFRAFLKNREEIAALRLYTAHMGNKAVGVIATRNFGSHIALFFVEGAYHRQGIGAALFQKILSDSAAKAITVHSSPYARKVYEALGFTATAEEQLTDGLRYIPMVYRRNGRKHRDKEVR